MRLCRVQPRSERLAEWLIPRLSTFVFNYIQLGIIVFIIPQLYEFPEKSFLLLAFEIAILLDSASKGGKIKFWSVVAFASSIGFCSSTVLLEVQSSTPTQILSIFFLSLSLKKIRTATGAKGPLKKWWRAYGYLAAGFFNIWFLVTLITALLVTVFLAGISSPDDGEVEIKFFVRKHLVSYFVVLFHHLHYFSYAYFVVVIASTHLGVPTYLLGAYFYIGWVAYYAFERMRENPKLKVLGGHVMAAIAVYFMFISSDNIFPFTVLWFLTGLGGGTIILLRDMVTEADPDTYGAFKFWEAVGHVLGLLCFVAAIMLDVAAIPFIVGAMAGLACAFLVYLVPATKIKIFDGRAEDG